MRSISFLDRLNAIGVAVALASLGHGLHAPTAAWSLNGHLVFALALVPIAAWAAARCLRSPERRPVAASLVLGIALTTAAATGAAIALPVAALRGCAVLGAVSLALGHLACGYTRAGAAPPLESHIGPR